jgi:hypothetical protein
MRFDQIDPNATLPDGDSLETAAFGALVTRLRAEAELLANGIRHAPADGYPQGWTRCCS